VAVGLPVLLAIGVAVVGLIGGPASTPPAPSAAAADRTGPLPLVPVDAPDSGSPACAALLKALPAQVTEDGVRLPRRALRDPAPPATVAWGDAAHDPVVLRCGLGRPPELVQTSPLIGVSGVQWLQINGENGSATSYVVDRSVYVALTTTGDTGSGPVQDVSAAVAAALPTAPIRPNTG